MKNYPITASIIKSYNQKGFVVLKNFLTKKDVKKNKISIKNFLEKKIMKYSGRDINFANDRKKFENIHSFHRLHDAKFVKKFIKTKKVQNCVKLFLKTSSIELRASEYFAKPKYFGLPVPDHQDNYYWNVKKNKALTIWIALSHSSKKNGGIYYYTGSHKKGVISHKPSFKKGSSQTIKNIKLLNQFKKVTPELNIGDALIHSCSIVHGSRKNKGNILRKGWTMQFKDKNTPYDLRKIKKYEKSLLKQIKLRKKS